MKSFYPFFSIVECKRDNLMTQGACNANVLFWFLPNVLIRSKKVLTKWAHLYFCRLLHSASKVTNHLKLMILIAMIYLLSVSKVINPNLVSQSLKIDTSNALEQWSILSCMKIMKFIFQSMKFFLQSISILYVSLVCVCRLFSQLTYPCVGIGLWCNQN